ncbi:MAG: hypothetical protein PVH19_06740, partial [Planctomycetia bacterium]
RSVKGHRLFENRKLTIGSQYQFPTDESVSFRVVDSKSAVRAFLDAAPKQPLGPLGQIVLQVVDNPESSPTTYRFSLEKMLQEGIVPIDDTTLRVQVTQFVPSKMQARLAIFDTEKKGVKPRIILLSALTPIFNLQDPDGEVFGSFWFSAMPAITSSKDKESEKPSSAKDAFFKSLQEIMKSQPQAIVDADISMEKVQRMFDSARMPRVDLIQGPGDALTDSSKNTPQLYIRKWDGRQVTAAGPFDPDAKQIEWFAETGRPLRVKVRYTPAEEPGEIVRPISYKTHVPDEQRSRASQRVQVRLTVGQMCETFWLTDRSVSKDPSELQKTIIDRNQHVNLTLRRNEIQLGFGVHLDDFSVEYSPGHPQPTRYASQIDFVHLPKPDEKKDIPAYETDITVEGNRPATFKDPSDGRVYRFFQNSFNGPYQPGDKEFEQFVGGAQKRNSLYFSYFGVAYDPGRFWKYAGCFMIIFGIAIMYYMKAYFFRRFSDRIKQ